MNQVLFRVICQSTGKTNPTLDSLSFQTPITKLQSHSKIYKLSLNLSLTHLRAQISCYELKEKLSAVMLKEIFYDSFENFEITRVCMENHASVTGCEKLFFSYKWF